MKRAALCLSLLLSCLLCRASFTGEAPAGNPLEDIKMMRNLAAAESALAGKGAAAVSAVSKLLNENEVGPRIIAAKILARIAGTVVDPGLTQALNACFKDSNAGVRYWGFRGLTQPKQANPNFAEILRRSLRAQESDAMKLMAAMLAGEHKVAEVTPEMMALLEAQAKTYEKALVEILTSDIEGLTIEQETMDGEGVYGGMHERYGGRGGMRERYEGRGRIPTAMPAMPAVGRPGEGAPGEPGSRTKPLVDPDKLDLKTKKALIKILDESDDIENLRTIGVALEKATGQKWGFKGELPWKLRGPVDKAIGWFKKKGGGK